MKTPKRVLPLVALLVAAAPAPVLASGKLIFATGDVFILAPDGAKRPGHQGDLVRAGERIVTGGGAMAQVKLEDGSFVGVRPDSDLQLRSFTREGRNPGSVLMLDKGSVRVLNIETDAKEQTLPVRLQSANGAAVLVRGGDLESRRAVGLATTAPMIARLNAGAAVVQTGLGEQSLPPLRVSSLTPTEVLSAPPTALPPVALLPASEAAAAGPNLLRSSAPIAPDVARTPAAPSPIPVPYPNLALVAPVVKTDLFVNPGIVTAPSISPALRPVAVGAVTGPTTSTVQQLAPVVQPTIILSTKPLVSSTPTTGGTTVGTTTLVKTPTTTPTTTSVGTLQIGGTTTTILAPTTSTLLLLRR
jgi:hypothetical protein